MSRKGEAKNCKGRVFNYTPYEDIKKEQQKIERIVTYKHYSSEQGELKEKRDYSNTINNIVNRQRKV